ncbi:MAG: membrane protein insertion efficiency factor YidD [Melioribacter sp.]|uniref:membrane protein insertion efficiency factor YidD n=1 Tax=Rosettibacter primus TaxID=3111523 RepID=UPI00247C1EF2|nr:membrane protein insertion efficiency factor YidD [Melioribacter sp.]
MKNIVIILMLSSLLKAQTDWIKWEKYEVNYSIKLEKDDTDANSDSKSNVIVHLKNFYSLLISDYDGDNCPFSPSCSEFFVQAVKETNLIKGTLMFVDRFTRDINFFKGTLHYPRYKNSKFYDPVNNYTLVTQKIIYNSPTSFVK